MAAHRWEESVGDTKQTGTQTTYHTASIIFYALCHNVAVGLADGGLPEEFEIPHTAVGFLDFFARIKGHVKRHPR